MTTTKFWRFGLNNNEVVDVEAVRECLNLKLAMRYARDKGIIKKGLVILSANLMVNEKSVYSKEGLDLILAIA